LTSPYSTAPTRRGPQHQALVDAAARIAQHQVFAAFAADEIAGRIQVHAGHLELGGRGLLHVAAMAGAGQVRAAHAGLVPDRRHQAEGGLAVLHAFAHGVDARVVGLQVSSTTMARSQCRPAALASSMLGRTPAVITTRSAGICCRP
jgi:hypothetical protein